MEGSHSDHLAEILTRGQDTHQMHPKLTDKTISLLKTGQKQAYKDKSSFVKSISAVLCRLDIISKNILRGEHQLSGNTRQ